MAILPSLTLAQRKAVILMCRSQSLPFSTTTFGSQVLSKKLPESIFDISGISEFIESPSMSNLIIELVLSSPMPDTMVESTKRELVNKEIRVLETDPLPPEIDWHVFFDEGRQSDRIHPSLEPNEPMASLVHHRLCLWRQKVLSYGIIYPRISRKTVSKDTLRNYEDFWSRFEGRELDGSAGMISQIELENTYHQTGEKVGGVCEMRQVWYRAQATPRTYYATGGTAYWKSRFIQRMMNDLVDSLACTERYSRVNPSRLLFKDNCTGVIYDLSSFTSNCHEQRPFLHMLSSFCSGCIVTVMDAREGPIDVDLGELILEYNTLNDNAEYSTERVIGCYMLLHHQAGFLGVYGNIASCTFVHGCVALQTVGSEDEINVAGDDGLIGSVSKSVGLRGPRLIGVFAEEKCGTADEANAVHLKRPIHQVGQRVVPGHMVIWPSFELLMWRKDSVDPRFPDLADLTRKEVRSMMASSICRFLYHLHAIPCSDAEVDQIFTIVEFMYGVLQLPKRGNLPQCGGDPDLGIVACLSRSTFLGNPYHEVVKQLYSGVVVLSARRGQVDEEEEEFYPGARFRSRSSPRLQYLETLGYLLKEEIKCTYIGEVGQRLLIEELDHSGPAVYQYYVQIDIPTYLIA